MIPRRLFIRSSRRHPFLMSCVDGRLFDRIQGGTSIGLKRHGAGVGSRENRTKARREQCDGQGQREYAHVFGKALADIFCCAEYHPRSAYSFP
jgi:hypothetical protein